MTSYDQLIYDTAKAEGFSPEVAKYIVAQARLESADYSSSVFNCNNNMYGMKFVGQPLATRGTIAPASEVSSGCTRIINSGCDRKGDAGCNNSDYYAKYSNAGDSVKDVIQRLYRRTMYGVTFEDLKNSTSVLDFAQKLKKRHYYGEHDFSTSLGQAEALGYAGGLKAKLLLIKITEYYQENKKVINTTLIALLGFGIIGYGYFAYKKFFSSKK